MDMDYSDAYRNLKPPAVVRHTEPSELERLAQDKSAANIILRNFYNSIVKEFVHSLTGANSLSISDENGKSIEVYRNKSGRLIAGVTYNDFGNIEEIIYYRNSGTLVISFRNYVPSTDGILLKPDCIESINPDNNQARDKSLKKSIEKYIKEQRKIEEGIKIKV